MYAVVCSRFLSSTLALLKQIRSNRIAEVQMNTICVYTGLCLKRFVVVSCFDCRCVNGIVVNVVHMIKM